MSEANEKQTSFLGTYFDRDGVLRLARWADVVAWIILTIYILWWLTSFLPFFSQYLNGMFFDKGSTFLNVVNIFAGQLQQPLPGVFYFFGLQGISKGLLMFMDMEDNTRRAARKWGISDRQKDLPARLAEKKPMWGFSWKWEEQGYSASGIYYGILPDIAQSVVKYAPQWGVV